MNTIGVHQLHVQMQFYITGSLQWSPEVTVIIYFNLSPVAKSRIAARIREAATCS